MLLPSENPLKYHEEVFVFAAYYDPTPKRFDIFPPDWGMLRRSLDAFRFFFEEDRSTTKKIQVPGSTVEVACILLVFFFVFFSQCVPFLGS